jgi:hypothetical protein
MLPSTDKRRFSLRCSTVIAILFLAIVLFHRPLAYFYVDWRYHHWGGGSTREQVDRMLPEFTKSVSDGTDMWIGGILPGEQIIEYSFLGEHFHIVYDLKGNMLRAYPTFE